MNGLELIAAERHRQIEIEGWTPEHDDLHEGDGEDGLGPELIRGALCYANRAGLDLGMCGSESGHPFPIGPHTWPWDSSWWKPSDDPIRNLVKAGALIAAEIDRLQRATS